MLSGIRKQRNILMTINDEIGDGIDRLKNISLATKEAEKIRKESKELIRDGHTNQQCTSHKKYLDVDMTKQSRFFFKEHSIKFINT